jgi:hypothetical protein
MGGRASRTSLRNIPDTASRGRGAIVACRECNACSLSDRKGKLDEATVGDPVACSEGGGIAPWVR